MSQRPGREVDLGPPDRHRTRRGHGAAVVGQDRILALHPGTSGELAELEDDRRDRDRGEDLDRQPGQGAVGARQPTGEEGRDRGPVHDALVPRSDRGVCGAERVGPPGLEQGIVVHGGIQPSGRSARPPATMKRQRHDSIRHPSGVRTSSSS